MEHRPSELLHAYAYSDSARIERLHNRRIRVTHDKLDTAPILTVNAGSSSVRLAAFERGPTSLSRIAFRHLQNDASPTVLLADFVSGNRLSTPVAIAHRVVHGGERLVEPCLIDSHVEATIARLIPLAPLHNPVALQWIQACRDAFGDAVLQIAVFDTAFYSELPLAARSYPLPKALSEKYRLRRYGFHGLAHESMWRRWCAMRPDLDRGGRIITLQLGSGCSMTAIDRGMPQDTSMGFSPLEGLMMSTRSGDVDPGLITYLQQHAQLSASEIETVLTRQSGLLGVSGEHDIQALLRRDDDDARLALAMYCHRIRKYVGAYLAVLGGADAILLGGGVAEHAPPIRESILTNMEWAGIALDTQANVEAVGIEACITRAQSHVQAWIVPVDEAALLGAAAATVLRQREELR